MFRQNQNNQLTFVITLWKDKKSLKMLRQNHQALMIISMMIMSMMIIRRKICVKGNLKNQLTFGIVFWKDQKSLKIYVEAKSSNWYAQILVVHTSFLETEKWWKIFSGKNSGKNFPQKLLENIFRWKKFSTEQMNSLLQHRISCL